MSVQSNKILCDLVKCQRFEGNVVCVNYDSETLTSMCGHGEEPIVIKFRYSKHEILSIFNHLVKEEYVVDISNGSRVLLIVTHKGNHQTQALVSKVFNLLCSSVLLPLAVSLLTNIAFGILDRLFPNLFI